MQDCRARELLEETRVHTLVVLWPTGTTCECPAGHQNDATAGHFDECALLFIGADDIVECQRASRIELVRVRSASDLTMAHTALGARTPDQFLRAVPVES